MDLNIKVSRNVGFGYFSAGDIADYEKVFGREDNVSGRWVKGHMSTTHTHEQPALQETEAKTQGHSTRGRYQNSWVPQDAMVELLSCECELSFGWGKMAWGCFRCQIWLFRFNLEPGEYSSAPEGQKVFHLRFIRFMWCYLFPKELWQQDTHLGRQGIKYKRITLESWGSLERALLYVHAPSPFPPLLSEGQCLLHTVSEAYSPCLIPMLS